MKTICLQFEVSDEYDNTVLKQFEVPEEWLLNEVEEDYGSLQNILAEYTSDESEPIYCKAILDGVVLNETESRQEDITTDIEQIIKNLIEDNKANFELQFDKYGIGYAEGYNDALVDLLNKLGVKHNYEIMND